MSSSSLQKDIILSGTDSLAVLKEDGLVYRVAEIAKYTPIVFRNLKQNTRHEFDLSAVISKDYKVLDFRPDVKGDDDLVVLGEVDANDQNYPSAYITIVKNGKRTYSRFLGFPGGEAVYTEFLISPSDTIVIQPNRDINALTFICVPIYVESPIVVPEVIVNETVEVL